MKFPDPKSRQPSLAAACILACLLSEPACCRLDAATPPTLLWRWSNPCPHGANVYGMAHGLGLTVQVGDRGQIHTSADLTVWEPRFSPTRRTLRGVAFLHNRVIITGEAGTVLCSPDFETYLLQDLQTEDWLEGVAASTNLAVAVGDNGAVYTSTDGLAWHRQDSGTPAGLRSVAHGGGTFVAVGEGGRVLTSPDGTNWTRRLVPTARLLNGVAWVGNRFMIAADNGQYLLSQYSGTSWSLALAGTTNRLLQVSGSHSLMQYLLPGQNELLHSHDAEAWFDQTADALPYPAPVWTYYHAQSWPGTFFVAGRSGMMVEGYQTNLFAPFHWFNLTPSIRNWFMEVKRMPGFYVAVGHRGTIMTSENGRQWNLEYTPPEAQGEELLGIGGSTNLLLAVGQQGRVLLSPNVVTNLVTTNSSGSVLTNRASTMGVLWHTLQPSPTALTLHGVTHWDGLYVVAGEGGCILISADGTNWSPRPTPTTDYLTSVAGFPGGFVAVSTSGIILHSSEGSDWEAPQSPTTRWLVRVRWTGDRLLALGESGTLLSSLDGRAWEVHPTGTSAWLSDAVHIEGAFYLCGFQGTVLYSDDLVTFQDLGVTTGKSLLGLAAHRDQLVTVGAEGSILRASLHPNLDPVRFLKFDRVDGQNLFLIHGEPDQRIAIEGSPTFQVWSRSRVFEFLDETGTLLILDDTSDTEPDREFFRAATVP